MMFEGTGANTTEVITAKLFKTTVWGLSISLRMADLEFDQSGIEIRFEKKQKSCHNFKGTVIFFK